MIQVIVYSKVTGRVRRVVDPQAAVPNVLQFLAQAGAGTGEGTLVYNLVGGGADNLGAWQAAVSAHTGLIPTPLHPAILAQVQAAAPTATVVHDRYVAIDSNNIIQGVHLLDPACGDGNALPGMTLIQHDTADTRWTFTPPNTFTPPTITQKIPGA